MVLLAAWSFLGFLLVQSHRAMTVPALPYNPCPRIFRYERILHQTDEVNNNFWKGVVTIPKFDPNGESIRMKLIFAVTTTVPTKYVGRVSVRGDKERIFDGGTTPLSYDVIFPGHLPVPSLLQVRLNGRFLCNAPPPQAAVVTKIFLEHSLHPFKINATRRLGGTARTDDFSNEEGNENYSCGEFAFMNPLVVGGDDVLSGTFPWLVPIFMKTPRGLIFHCSGSLVSNSHVISAGHCFMNSKASDLVAYVGRHNIQDWTDSTSQTRGIIKINIHPEFERSTLYSDISVLELDRPVDRTNRITPVCLWHGDDSLDLIVGRHATVVGWGVSEVGDADISSIPRSVSMPIVTQETCLRSQKEYLYFSSNRTLCAGAKDGSGPCNGDSGGGLYLPIATPGKPTRWYLRGIVSLTLQDPITKQCDLQNYAVFTDVAKFQSWLQLTMLASIT